MRTNGHGHGLTARVRFGLRWAIDALYPPSCLACAEPVGADGGLCAACWATAALISGPVCDRCGAPVELAPADGRGLCEDCAQRPPPWSRARAAARYQGAARTLILALKHGDRTEAAPAMGRWMARAGRPLLAGAPAPLIAPAPLHWTRRAARRFNQASLLARAVARESGAPLALDLLRRRRATPSQGGRGRAGRAANVAGAFELAPRWRGTLAGRRILLVDDVMTTGATLAACAAALASEEAVVDILVFARVDQDP